MEAMRQSWTDDRLDDFRGEVKRRFDEVDRRFEAVDKRFEAVGRRFDRVDQRFDDLSRLMDSRFDAMQREMNARFDSLQRSMFQAAVALVTAVLTVAAAIRLRDSVQVDELRLGRLLLVGAGIALPGPCQEEQGDHRAGHEDEVVAHCLPQSP